MHIELPNVGVDSIYPNEFGQMVIRMSREITHNPDGTDANGQFDYNIIVEDGCTITVNEEFTYIES